MLVDMTTATPESEEPVEVVSVQQWLKDPNLVHSFKCMEVKVNGYVYERYSHVNSIYILYIDQDYL